MIRPFAVGTLALLTCGAIAQQRLLGPFQYPQFRSQAALPGGGYGVRPDGMPAFDGAMAFSTPIGYSLSNWNAVITASNTSDYLFFRLPHLTGNQGNNYSLGKLSGCGGISLRQFDSLSGSVMM